jgi:hypothetical protein
MSAGPAPSGHGRGEDPARHARGPGDRLPEQPAAPDWMTDQDWQARCSALALCEEDEPGDPERDPDPQDCAPPPGQDQLTPAEIAQCRELAAADARAAVHAARLGSTGALAFAGAALGRRGPGQPGSAHASPGEYPGPAASSPHRER